MSRGWIRRRAGSPAPAGNRGRPKAAVLSLALASTLLAVARVGAAPPPTLDAARALHGRGELEGAREAYLELLARGSPDRPVAAIAHNNLCVLLGDLGDYRSALDHCRRALELRRGLDDPRRLARTLNNLGLTLHRLGRQEAAAAALEEALELDRRLGEVASEVIVLSNSGLVALAAGRYGEALDRHRNAAQLASRHRDEPWAAEQLRVAWINEGVALEKLGAFDEAVALYRRVTENADSREVLGDRRWGHLHLNLGVLYRNLGDAASAVGHLETAAQLFDAAGDRAALASASLNLGQVRHLNLADPGGAETAYRRALELARASGDGTEEVQALFLLGRLLLEVDRLDEAEAAFESCLELSSEGGAAEALWSARLGLGLLARRRGEPRIALEQLEEAIEEVEATRSSLDEPTLRGGFFAPLRPVYATAVEVLGELGDPTDRAFELVQLAKERELTAALGVDPPGPQALDLGRLARRLGERRLLEYFVSDRRLVAWLVSASGDRLVLRRIDLGEPLGILRRVARVHAELAAGREAPWEDLQALAAALLWPFAEDLVSEELVVATDGRLRYLPFELLPLAAAGETPDGEGAGERELVLDRHVVTYLPSASALLGAGGGDGSADDLFGLGDPRLAPPSPQPSPAGLWAARFRLEPLPASAAELAEAARAMGGSAELHTGAAATESALFARSGRGARILHLAAHAVLDDRSGGGAAVLLAPSDGTDGVLRPEEISRLVLPARLTVLAACSSALGESDGVGALGSLTGAFLASGSRAVVSTLWQVPDQPASVVIGQLYHGLARGRDPALALTEVKRRLRQDPRWRSPHLWAGWVVTGDPVPVASPWRWKAQGLVLGGGIALLILAVGLWRRSSGRRGT